MTLLEPCIIDLAIEPQASWHRVCLVAKLHPDRGVCALLDGRQVAVFRTSHGELFAVANLDPLSGTEVMSRGIVGSIGGRPTVSSPMYKHRFDLQTGECLDDPGERLDTFSVRDVDDVIEICFP